MPIIMMYVVTIIRREGYWTENAVCLTAGGITEEERTRHILAHVTFCGVLTRSREQASGTGDQCAAICPDTSPGVPLILFKITVAVAAENRHGQRIERVAGVSVNCCFTVI